MPALERLVGIDHFAEDESGLYPGCPDEELKGKLNAQVDAVISSFISKTKEEASSAEYLELPRSEIERFDRVHLDTEEAEQVSGYFEEIMGCVGLESSQGALNTWLYGFDPDAISSE